MTGENQILYPLQELFHYERFRRAGFFSDGKYNITNDFGGTLYEHIGKQPAIELMKYVDEINLIHGGEGTRLYSTAGTKFKKICMQNGLNLLNASVRHLGTDINYVVLENLYNELEKKVDFYFDKPVLKMEKLPSGYRIHCADEFFDCDQCIVSVGRSGSKWMEEVCKEMDIPTKSNRVDIGVRVELPAVIFSDLTDELYESKIVYRTHQFEDNVRTFCMNPHGIVVSENTNGIVTVNGHRDWTSRRRTRMRDWTSRRRTRCWAASPDLERKTKQREKNLGGKAFSLRPFKDSNGYGGENIWRALSRGRTAVEMIYARSPGNPLVEIQCWASAKRRDPFPFPCFR